MTGRRRPLAMVVAGSALALVGCGSPAAVSSATTHPGTATTRPATTTTDPMDLGSCAATVLPAPSGAVGSEAPARTGESADLIPPTPTKVDVCRYSAVTASGGGTLARSATVTGTALATLVATVDSPQLAVVPAGVSYSCPNWDGAEDLLHFAYASGPNVTVTVDLGGCGFASNGTRTVDGSSIAPYLATIVGS